MKYDIESIEKRKQKMKSAKRIVDIIVAILIYNVILISLSCLSKIEPISIFGLQAYIVTTESMQPELKVGDFIIVRKVNQGLLHVGDIVTFNLNGQIITHRINEISNDNQFITKGDNNDIKDTNKITYDNIYGKFVMKIPIIGKILTFLENQLIFLIIILILLILYFYKLSIDERKEDRREKKEFEKKKKREE